jgi:hypothetical protein
MYGDAFVQEYLAIVGGAEPDVGNALKRWNIRWTILAPRDALVTRLDNTPGWRRIYSDPYAVVQVRTDALAPGAPLPPAPPKLTGATR